MELNIEQIALKWWYNFDLVTKLHIAQDWVFDSKHGSYQKYMNFNQIDKDKTCIVAMYLKYT